MISGFLISTLLYLIYFYLNNLKYLHKILIDFKLTKNIRLFNIHKIDFFLTLNHTRQCYHGAADRLSLISHMMLEVT